MSTQARRRLGVTPCGSIHDIRLCPYLLEMSGIHAGNSGMSVEEGFTGSVWLAPPLKLGYLEAGQVAWFLDRGLRVNIGGSMLTGGATSPVTVAGMVAFCLAECILLAFLNRALHGDTAWGLGMAVTAMDPRTAMHPYRRPDMPIANMMGAQMARRYGLPFSGQCGLAFLRTSSGWPSGGCRNRPAHQHDARSQPNGLLSPRTVVDPRLARSPGAGKAHA